MSSVCLREHIRGRVGWTGVHYVTHPHCVDILRCSPERAVFKQAFQRKLARSIVPYDAEDGAVRLLVMSHSVVSTCRPCPQHHLNNGIIIHGSCNWQLRVCTPHLAASGGLAPASNAANCAASSFLFASASASPFLFAASTCAALVNVHSGSSRLDAE